MAKKGTATPRKSPVYGLEEKMLERKGSRAQGAHTIPHAALGDVVSVCCKHSFPGTHKQGVLVLTQQQGRVVEDAWLVKLHQLGPSGEGRARGERIRYF